MEVVVSMPRRNANQKLVNKLRVELEEDDDGVSLSREQAWQVIATVQAREVERLTDLLQRTHER